MTGVVIAAARRTPIGTAGRGLAAYTAADLGAAAIGAVLGQVEREPAEVLLGNCLGPGGNLARVAALQAGLPAQVAALTVDRQCASGLTAIEIGARLVGPDHWPVIAGGSESASTAPWRYWPPTPNEGPVRYQRAPFAPEPLDLDMGLAADLLAADAGITRVRQDAYAARSHALAIAAATAGDFGDEIVPLGARDTDERPRAGLSALKLSRFPAAFRPEGTVTVGNSCPNSDGAAALALVPEDTGIAGLRILATASAGVDPTRPGLGLVPATRLALQRAGLSLDQMDVIEINEAFAGQVLACYDALGLDPERVCRSGGALALGHPWGASGAVLVVRLFSQLVRQGRGRYGLAAIAAGGGQGSAIVVEVVS